MSGSDQNHILDEVIGLDYDITPFANLSEPYQLALIQYMAVW